MLRIVLFYGWIMQEKETSVIREGEKNVSLQSSMEGTWGSAEGAKPLLPGSGVSPVHFTLLPGRRRRPASGT